MKGSDEAQGSGAPPTRREFVDGLLVVTLGATAVAVAWPVAQYVVPPGLSESQDEAAVLPFPLEELQVNSGRIFRFGADPGIVIRTPSGEVRAFSARCTHLSCIVQYAPEQSRVTCACHGGSFDLTGRNVGGPPPRPLPAFVVNLRQRAGGGHDIVVSRA